MCAKIDIHNDLLCPTSVKLFKLNNKIKKKDIEDAFDSLMKEYGADKISRLIRDKATVKSSDAVFSFLCVKRTAQAAFLKKSGFDETWYEYVLLVERNGYVAVINHGMSGIDKELVHVFNSIERARLMNVWGDVAVYQKMSMKRMAVAHQEIHASSYVAPDLEEALPISVAARSIPQSLKIGVGEDVTMNVVPSTGRIQKSGEKVSVEVLVEFIDEVLVQVQKTNTSAFLNAFAVPIKISDLPSGVVPTGVLIDFVFIDDYINERGFALKNGQLGISDLKAELTRLFDLVDEGAGNSWKLMSGTDEKGRIKKLKHTFSLEKSIDIGWSLEKDGQVNERLDKWINKKGAYSISFSSPEFFYTQGALYKRSGFPEEAKLVFSILNDLHFLSTVTSEKGDDGTYSSTTLEFSRDSVFGALEDFIKPSEDFIICSDLNDEWADYISFSSQAPSVSFYHCKHGDVTSGASDFHVVVSQALKNLSRVKFTKSEIDDKIKYYDQNPIWKSGATGINRLVKGASWNDAGSIANAAISSGATRWNVVLVVSSLSKADFVVQMSKASPPPYFIQLVWLLSAFASACKERDAMPRIICAP